MRRRELITGIAAFGGAAVAGATGPAAASADAAADVGVLREAPVNALGFLSAVDPGDPTPAEMGDALAAALQHAKLAGGRVFAPPGVYRVKELPVPADVHLFGAGDGTELRRAGDAQYAVRLGHTSLVSEGIGAAISDLRVTDGYGSSDPVPKRGTLIVYAPDCRVERVNVVAPRYSGIVVKGRAARAKVIGCHVSDPAEVAIQAELDETGAGDLHGLEIVGNRVEMDASGNRGVNVIRVGGITGACWVAPRIVGNRVRCGPGASPTAMGIQTWNQGVTQAVIEGNVVFGGKMGMSVNMSPRTSITGNLITGAGSNGIEIPGGTYQLSGLNRGTNGTTVAGNVIDGRGGNGPTEKGIVCTTGSVTPPGGGDKITQSLGSLQLSGNVIVGCITGISVIYTDSLSVVGNQILASDVPGAYSDAGDGEKAYSGMLLRNSIGYSAHMVCAGNHVDGRSQLPTGIRLDSVESVVCVGNRVHDCEALPNEPSHEIWMKAAKSDLAAAGKGTAGAISGNAAHVVVTNTVLTNPNDTAARAGCEDLRTDWNLPVLRTCSPSYGRLVIPATEAMVRVSGSETFDSVVNFHAGLANALESRNYPGREVTLVFAGSTTVDTGGNIRLAGALEAKAGDTLTLVGAGDDDPGGDGWFEASRSVN